MVVRAANRLQVSRANGGTEESEAAAFHIFADCLGSMKNIFA
jgi:hypothetical protein